MTLEDLTVKKRKEIREAISYYQEMEEKKQREINSLRIVLGITDKLDRSKKKRADMLEREIEERERYLQSYEHKRNRENAKKYKISLEKTTAEYEEYWNKRRIVELYIKNGCLGEIPKL